jgi:hypothetical protein
MPTSLRTTIAVALVLASVPAAAQTLRATAAEAPPDAKAPPPTGAPSDRLAGSTWRGTLLVGLSHLSDRDGLAARVDLDTDLAPLSPRVMVGAVLSLGLSRWSSSQTTTLVPGSSMEAEATAYLVDLVPAFRATLQANRLISLHADTGLGLSYGFGSATTRAVTPGGTVSSQTSSSGVGSALRLAAGGAYHVAPRLKLGVDVGLDFHFGEMRGTAVTVLAAAAYRL